MTHITIKWHKTSIKVQFPNTLHGQFCPMYRLCQIHNHSHSPIWSHLSKTSSRNQPRATPRSSQPQSNHSHYSHTCTTREALPTMKWIHLICPVARLALQCTRCSTYALKSRWLVSYQTYVIQMKTLVLITNASSSVRLALKELDQHAGWIALKATLQMVQCVRSQSRMVEAKVLLVHVRIARNTAYCGILDASKAFMQWDAVCAQLIARMAWSTLVKRVCDELTIGDLAGLWIAERAKQRR